MAIFRKKVCRIPIECLLLFILFAPLTSSGLLTYLPYNATLPRAIRLVMEKEGLAFLSHLLTDGLVQADMRREVIRALEDQVFYVLVPNFGGYAKITVDYGITSRYPEKDGFRYDDVAVTVDTIPKTNAFPISSGVLYPILFLNRYSQGIPPNYLPELHVRIEYPLLPQPVSAIAYGKVTGYALLWASLSEGSLKGYIQDFTTRIQDFEIGFPNQDTGVIIQALGEVLLRDWRNELEDALSSVLKSGINSLLFDRNQDGTPDTLIDLVALLESLNRSLGSRFSLKMEGFLGTNTTEPARILVDLSGSFVQNEIGPCVSPDVAQGFRYTEWEEDGSSGHDPPPITARSPSGNASQIAVALSDDFLNQVLFNAYRTGLGCLFIAPDDPSLPPEIPPLMNVGNLSLFGIPWLAQLYPKETSFGVELRIAKSPYVQFALASDPYPFELHLPELTVSVYLLVEERWFRLMGARGSLVLKVSLNHSENPQLLFDLGLSTQVTSEVTFSEIYPEGKEDLTQLLPQAAALLSDLLKTPLSELQKTILSCIPGISTASLEFAPLAADPSLGLSHYLGLWVTFTGSLHLERFLNQCLFGGTSPPFTMAGR